MRMLRFHELKAKGVPWTRVHIMRLENAGKFPRRVPLAENSVVWIEEEVDAWLAGRVAARNGAKAS